MSDIIERLRKTASRGASVWGDLQMEAADELERLRAALAQPAPEPVALMALHDINELMHCNGMSVFVENPRIYPPYCEGEPLAGFVPLYATPPAQPAPAVREPHEPYLCIKPACGPDCSGCNCAISPQDMRDYAVRYAILRNAPIDAIRDGGVFAGKTPDNVVINGEHLDAAVDALRGITGDGK